MAADGAAFPLGYRVNKGWSLNNEEFFVTTCSSGFFAHNQNLLASSQVNRISVIVLNPLEKESKLTSCERLPETRRSLSRRLHRAHSRDFQVVNYMIPVAFTFGHSVNALASACRPPSVLLQLPDHVFSLLRIDISKGGSLPQDYLDNHIGHRLRIQLMSENVTKTFEHFGWGEVLRWIVPMRHRIGAAIVEACAIRAWVHRCNLHAQWCQLELQPLSDGFECMLAGRISSREGNGK